MQAESRLANSHAVLVEARQIRSTERERLRQAEVSLCFYVDTLHQWCLSIFIVLFILGAVMTIMSVVW